VQIGDGEHAVVVDAWTPDRRSMLAKDAALLRFGPAVKSAVWYPGIAQVCPWTQLKGMGVEAGRAKASVSCDVPVSSELGLKCYVADWLGGKLFRQWNVLSAFGSASDNETGRRPVYVCDATGESHNPDLVLISAREALLQSERRLNETGVLVALAAAHVEGMNPENWATALREHCTFGDLSAIELQLAHANAEVREHPDYRLMLGAALNVLIESRPDHLTGSIARLLLSAGAPVDSLDHEGLTPLARACARGRADMVQVLLDVGARWDTPTATGMTAAHFACISGTPTLLDILAGSERGFEVPDANGFTPLAHVAACGLADRFTDLVQRGASVAACAPAGDALPMLVASNGHWDVVQLLLVHGYPCPPALPGERLLDLARQQGRGDVGTFYQCLLVLALSASPINRPLATALLHAGAELSVEQWKDLLQGACRNEDPTLMEILLGMSTTETAADVVMSLGLVSNCVGEAALQLVKLLLDAGAGLDEVNAREQSLLMRACSQGATSMVEMLLARGASTELADEAGITAQMYAQDGGHQRIVDVLAARTS
jgi:ankyrin repeat protein